MLSKRRLTEFSKLKTKKGRSQQRRFLIEGLRLCEEATDSSWPIESVLFTRSFEQKPRGKRLLRKLQKRNTELIPVKSQVLGKLSDTVTAQGIVFVAKTKSLTLKDLWEWNLRVIVALDGIGDPGNVGTLIRTADALGIDAVILSGETVELYNPKVVRSSMGSVFHLPVFDEVDLEKAIPQLKKRKFKILGTDVRRGRKIERLNPTGKICLLIGSEAEGLGKELLQLCDDVIRIATYGKAESLNVAVAGGILLHEVAKQRMRG
ncbi:MAG: RNA methyltransferase [Candidatus Zixiibacteriota bacterium]